MRHNIIRIGMTLIWMVVAIVCAVNGDLKMAVMYGLIGVIFAFSVINKFNKKTNGVK